MCKKDWRRRSFPKTRRSFGHPARSHGSCPAEDHRIIRSKLGRPKKQRLTAKRIWELLIQDGHKIGYTSVKDEVVRWKRTNGPREVFILQEPRVGQRAEFDWGEVTLNIAGVWQKFYLAVFVLPFSFIDLLASITDQPVWK